MKLCENLGTNYKRFDIRNTMLATRQDEDEASRWNAEATRWIDKSMTSDPRNTYDLLPLPSFFIMVLGLRGRFGCDLQ
jgi:hypothetical protein